MHAVAIPSAAVLPSRLTPPAAPLTDGVVTLRPLTSGDAAAMGLLVDDPLTRRFTMVPFEPAPDFAAGWLARYVDGWADGTRAGFAVERDGAFAGFASLLQWLPDAAQGELGYVVAPAARGAGVGARALRLLSDWCLGPLGLERVELRIDALNAGSLALARRCGFTCEGTLRNVHFKEGARCDLTVWSRLREDGGASAAPAGAACASAAAARRGHGAR